MTGARIGHVINAWPQQGGVAQSIEALLLAAEGDGDAATVYSWPDPRPGARSFARTLSHVARLPPGLEHDLPGLDVIVFHGAFVLACGVSARLLRHRKVRPRLVAFPHDSYDEGLFGSETWQKRWLKRAWWRLLERPYLRSVDVIQVTAPTHIDWLRKRGAQTPAVVSPLGWEPARTLDAAATRTTDHGPRRLLFLGRWDVYEKGLDLLLPALAGQLAGPAGWRLRMVGPEVGAREQVAKLAADNGVEVDLVGWVEDVDAEFAHADALVLPSRKEGFGLVVLEALGAGLPGVATRVAGVTEHLPPRSGWLVAAPEVVELRAALKALLDNLDQQSADARAVDLGAAGYFSWAGMHRSLLAAGRSSI